MSEKTKRILIRRKIRETVIIRRDEPLIFVCENCGGLQKFTPAENDQSSIDGEIIGRIQQAGFIETRIIKKGEK